MAAARQRGGARVASKKASSRLRAMQPEIHSLQKNPAREIFLVSALCSYPVEREVVCTSEAISQYRSLYARAHKSKALFNHVHGFPLFLAGFLAIVSACEFVNMEPGMSIFNIFKREPTS